jgi:NAD-dependent deacetylase
MKNLVVLTGAGMSAESGLKTFRDTGGLWEEYDVMEVCSAEGWAKNPARVLEFYNQRRKQLINAQPNTGHQGLVELEKFFNVNIITQNVDNLHEKAGSKNVLHLHGELMKVRSSVNDDVVYELTPEKCEITLGDLCAKGSQLRPHIVFFGEAVPAIEQAIPLCERADLLVVIGTSLNVYPAAGLIYYAPNNIPLFLLDPNPAGVKGNVEIIPLKAGEGINLLIEKLMHYV